MNKIKMFFAKHFFKELFVQTSDAGGSTGGATGRELASELIKRNVYKESDETEFEDYEFDPEDIQNGYNTDSYIRQGVDKYVDQIFKEGYTFYGTDQNVVDYLNLRLAYIAEASQTPTSQLLMDIAEDVVKYGNCMLIKARTNDPNALPQGANVQGLWGKDPVGGYFCANPVTIKCQRDEYGQVQKWQQKTDAGEQEFDPNDVVHFYYKREKGMPYGTSFLVPVLDDVKALRQAEENVLKMMYRFIYPFYHVIVGTEDAPGTSKEVDMLKDSVDGMDIEGGMVTTERVTIKPIASDKVISAEPYLKYMESRVFSGMGIPEIMFGRGDTANRSTGDNMTSEMADRIRAISKVIEMFFNSFVIKELLMEGGYDPVLNPEQNVEFRFNDNDVDVEIKKQVHAIYKYEHNVITEDEMRKEIGMDPIEDSVREHMFVELITRETIRLEAELSAQASAQQNGTSETNNKQKNQGGNKSGSGSTKKKDYISPKTLGLIKDSLNNFEDNINNYIKSCYDSNKQILYSDLKQKTVDCNKEILYTISKNNENINMNDVTDYCVKLTTNLLRQINDDLIGINTSNNRLSDVQDVMNIRLGIFNDNMIKFVKNTSFIERGS